nr:PNGase F N-terminal domain-containing protein [uncultured Carboxylicivirga sp.]
MKISCKQIVLIYILAATYSCHNKFKSIRDKEIIIFNNEPINFNPEQNRTNLNDSIIKIENGRIILKKVTLPKYVKHADISIEANLVSAGDPWDKTGSLFIIPSSSQINFLTNHDSFVNIYEETKDEDLFTGITPIGKYSPSIELLRFMTPFGVGYYSHDPQILKRKPVYIPHWENKVTWQQEITQLCNELENEFWIGAFIDVWTKEGYQLSAKLKFEETKAEVYPQEETKVIPLVNTVRYAESQRLFDGFNRNDISCEFELDQKYSSAHLYYITTGHGGHSTGDEFVKKENIVSVNGHVLYKDIPWRDDCASFRRFNPHSGVWTKKRVARVGNLNTGDTKEMEIEEFEASSDLSRSNWCPGSQVEPFIFPVDNLHTGTNTITISIPEAQAETENELNHWNVSAYIVLTK